MPITLQELEGDSAAAQETLAKAVGGCLRSLCPGESVSVRVAELLGDDWEVQIGETGVGRMKGADRSSGEQLRAAIREAITQFRGLC